MRTMKIAVAVLLAAGLRAQAQTITAEQACDQLKAAAKAVVETQISCTGDAQSLKVPAGTFAKLKAKLFPEGKFAGFSVVSLDEQKGDGSAVAVKSGRAAELADLKDAVASVNFDHAAGSAAGELKPAVATMGTISGAKVQKVQFGPPGSQDGPPGSERGGPPGSGGGDQDGPPGSGNPQQGGGQTTPPPSRPAPVWRQRFAPPPPNWWNTEWDNYEWWQDLPGDFDQAYTRKVSEDRVYLYSGYSRWPDLFSTGWVRETDSTRINWRANDAPLQPVQRTLTSQVHRNIKQCYYQDVYRYDWVSGGFYGSHWEESFDHYEARCIRMPTEYGRPRVATVYIGWDFKNAPAFLPWETQVQDGVTVNYDGNHLTYELSQRLLQYKVRLDDRQSNSETWTIVSGAKLNQPPERDKVSAWLENKGGVKLIIDDQRDAFYDGETLEVAVEIKKDSGHWYKKDQTVLQRYANGPIRVVVRKGAHPQAEVDVPNQGSGKYYISSWSFRRAQSKISTGDWVEKGGGNKIQY